MATTNLGTVAIHGEGDWSVSNAYTKLSIVAYNGGSYMALQDVPAGTALTDSSYWMPVSDTRETVRELIEQHPEWVTTVEDGSITEEKLAAMVKQQISSSSAAVQELDSRAESLETIADQHETDIGSLGSRMSAIEAGTTPEGSEVIGIRTSWDGTTYATAGDAVRGQVGVVNRKADAVIRDYDADLMYLYGSHTDETTGGITYSWNAANTACTLTGVAASTTFKNFFSYADALPYWLQPGDELNFSMDGFGDGLGIRCYLYPSTLPSREITKYESFTLKIPNGCTGVRFRFQISSGTDMGDGRYVSFEIRKSSTARAFILSGDAYSSDNKLDLFDSPDSFTVKIPADRLLQAPAGLGAATVQIVKINTQKLYEPLRKSFCCILTEETAGRTYIYNSGTGIWTLLAGDAIADYRGNRYDILAEQVSATSGSSNGVAYSRIGNDNTWRVSGVPTGTSFKNLVGSSGSPFFPAGIAPGDNLHLSVSVSNPAVGVRVYYYPSTLANRNVFYSSDADIHIPENCTGILIRLEVPAGTTLDANGDTITVALYASKTQRDITNALYEDNHLNLLVFGSSFSYSTLGYLVPIMKEIAPELTLRIGICYDSGQTIAGHITRFQNQSAYTTYREYVPETNSWIADTATTPQAALSRHRWDYVVMQQACRHTSTEREYQDMHTFAGLISGYLNYPFGFLFNMPQVLGANCNFPAAYTQPTGEEKSTAMYALMAAYAARTADDFIVTDVLPCGTAVQNARTVADFKTMGVNGYLSEDSNGHLQNGLPILVGAYTAAYKLMQLMGKKPKLFSIPLLPTDEWVAETGVPTSGYGTCVGVTPEELLVAQKCAMAAIKHPYAVTQIV